MKRMRRYLSVLLAVLMLFTAGMIPAAGAAESEIVLYYLSLNEDGLYQVQYTLSGGSTEGNVESILGLVNGYPDSSDYIRLLPDNVSVLSYSLSDGSVTLSFSDGYESMENTREVLARAGIVRTMVQIDGVNTVRFLVGDHEAVDAAGNPLGVMSGDSFVEDAGRMVNAVQHTSINLYFATADGSGLRRESRSIYYSASKPLEWAIVERVIAGPKVEGNYATVPSNLQIIGVTTSGGICYVNLNQVFETNQLAVEAKIPVYSIVNSICANCPEVNEVQFAIDGDSNIMLRSEVDLSVTYQADMSLVVE